MVSASPVPLRHANLSPIMKSSDRLSSARFRIMCVAVVAIVVPSLVLAGFGLQLSTEHRYRTEEVVRRAYQTTVDS